MKLEDFVPLNGHTLVEVKEDLEITTPAGIVLPQTTESDLWYAEVIVDDPQVAREDAECYSHWIDKGNTVVFGRNVGVEIIIEKQKLRLVPTKNILGRFE